MNLGRQIYQALIGLAVTLTCSACESTEKSDNDSSADHTTDAFIHEVKGSIDEAFGNRQGAIDEFSKTIKFNPQDVYAHDMRGGMYLEFEQYEKAIDDFNQAVKYSSKDAFAYNDRGWCYAMLGKYKQAVDDAKKSIELAPQMSNSYDTLGYAQYGLGLIDDALKSYNKSIELNANDGYVYYHRATLYKKLKKQDLAQQDYDKAVGFGYVPKKSEQAKSD
jgi:tetratricopeptide (TPR) repeat protein